MRRLSIALVLSTLFFLTPQAAYSIPSCIDLDVGGVSTATKEKGRSIKPSDTSGAPVQAKKGCKSKATLNVGISASDDASTAKATAIGIDPGNGKDVINSHDPVTVNAYSDIFGADITAIGINAGNGKDKITNRDLVDVDAVATAPDTKVIAIGIDAGNGKDEIANFGSVKVTSSANTNAEDLAVAVQGTASANSSLTAQAEAKGIDGGRAKDVLTNTGTVEAKAEANANSESTVVRLFSFGNYVAPTTATAGATGIEGGSGSDMMANGGSIEANAESHAQTGSVSVSLLQYEATAVGDARTEANATAVGMDAGDGDDSAVNTGTITLTADATATTGDVSIEAVGDVKANASTTSSASAVGIEGGAGNDGISNTGSISMNSITAVSVSTAVDVKFLNIPTAIGEKLGVELGDAKTEAKTDATGIAGGSGNDAIDNSGTIDIFTFADADSNSVTVALTIAPKGGGSPKAAGPNVGMLTTTVATAAGGGAAVTVTTAEDSEEKGDDIVDTGTNTQAFVTGIDGDDGMDTLTNAGKIFVTGESDADSVSVNPTISIAKGSVFNIFPGAALAESGTTAHTEATGMDGGAGNDRLANEDELVIEAFANSTNDGVAVLVKETTTKGLAWGGAIAKAETKANATAKGMAGDDGDDDIQNSGKITVSATPDADSANISATLMGAKEGLVAGFTYADAATKAEANATGIDGGEGKDTITNTGTGEIEVTATPTSTSAQVGTTVEGGFSQEWSAIIGGAITDGTTEAVSNAAGIDAGEDEDTVTNSGKITVTTNPDADSASVSVTLTGTEDGLTAGFTYADAETTAKATAVGISGGTGDDTITNARTGQIEVKANPTSTSASIGVTLSGVTKGTGIVGGAALSDGTTRAVSNVAGITGNADDDTITNAGKITVTSNPDADSASVSVDVGVALGELGLVGGLSYADTETTAEVTAVGIDGGTGDDTITNSGTIEVTTWPTSTGASIGVTVEAVKGLGGAIGAALTDGTTKAVSKAFGINGGADEDSINNSGTITVDSKSNAGSTSVSVDIVGGKEGAAAGVSYADATTTAEATASGIADHSGQAAVTNSGTILALSTAVTDSESVSVSATGEKTGLAAGVSLADLTTLSTAASYGIDTGDIGTGNDVVWNLGTVDADATATTTADSVAVTLSAAMTGVTAGVSAAKSDVTATTTAVGARTGRGDDAIFNDGIENAEGYSLDSFAHATADSDTVAVTASGAWEGVALGASLAKADTQASATAVGIDAGEGSDTVTSESGIRAKAVSDVTSNTVSVDVAFSYKGVSAGVALSSTRTDSNAVAAGISGGGGNDEVTNRSSVDAEATATTKTKTITVDIATIGAALSDASSTATAEGVGLDGGRGGDFLINGGDISVQATSTADDTQTTANFIGKAAGNVDSTATAAGIRGDDADDQTATGDTIANLAGGSITVTSHAKLDATNYVIQGGGAAFADATGTIEARAAGIASGAGVDSVVNGGSVDVTAWSEADVSSMELQFAGVSFGKAGAELTTRATGIDAGHGANSITNNSGGLITVNSKANATADSLTVNLGASFQRAVITAKTHSAGILSGDDKDDIHNNGNIVVTASTSMGTASGDISLVGLSTADSVTTASVEGINAGGGADVIENTGSITVGNIADGGDPMAYVEVANVSISFSKIGLGFLSSKALAKGIVGGDGDDTISNTGTIAIGGDDWMSKSKAVGFQGNFLEFFSLTGVGAAGETVSTGISGGQGNDEITNGSSGVVDVKATAYALSDGAVDVTTFGSPTVFANATANTTATGISGGAGDDVMVNLGQVAAEAKAWADTTTDAWVGWGNPTADSYSHAVATAWGIDSGGGVNSIRNEGEISADSVAGTHSFAKADSNIAKTESTAASWAEAFSYGVAGGDDGNTVFNADTGTITTTALARTYDPQAGMVTRAESDENATAKTKTSKPVTAYAAGILLGDGDDTVVNDGLITVDSQADARASATSNSWPNSARSEANVTGAATALGIVAGEGQNSITNSGLIDVDAWGNASPSADSWSRDQTATANAFADVSATATGIEADGEIINAQAGSIEVKARATSNADANTEAETTTATATLTATATGIGSISNNDKKIPDRIRNDGSLLVVALAGEDENGTPIQIALADTDLKVRSCKAETHGSAIADAAGILISGGTTGVINTGDITVNSRARGHLKADAFSRDYNPTANAHSNAQATAVGIRVEGQADAIKNSSGITVNALAEAAPTGSADSWSSTTHTNVYAGSIAEGKGIFAGDSDNTIQNDQSGGIKVKSAANVDSYSGSDENANAFCGVDEDTSVESNSTGIEAGAGNNVIANLGSITAGSEVTANSHATASSVTFTATAKAKTGAWAGAAGIMIGDGNNTIINDGPLTVRAANNGMALANFPSSHLDWSIADAGGNDTALTSDATGIRAGDGVNDIETHDTMTVTSATIASAEAYANTSTSTNHGVAYAGGVATGAGIAAGDGQNRIKNYGDMTVSVTADVSALGHAEDYGEAYIGSKSIAIGSENTPGVTAKAIGIKLGSGTNEIGNFGSLDVDATATADAKGWAHTTSVDAHGKAVAISFAWATGIRTGDGTNSLSNSGSIGVTATGNASAVTDVYSTHNDEFRDSYEATDARADGIQTGSGDDSITNHGIISAKTVDVIASHSRSAATGIDGGNGDNIITNSGTVVVNASAVGISAQVTAAGVRSGSGADVVINGGTIDVTAKPGGLIAVGTSFGISTGEGNDTIDNRGVIKALGAANGVSSPGIGIDSGGGNDTVSLLGETFLSGSITLGHGDDTLVLTGSPVAANGLIYADTYANPASGYDTAIFDGSGTFDAGLLSGFDEGLKTGSGVYTVPKLPISVIEVIEGTLLVDNDYPFSPKGKYTAHIYPDGNCGVLQINGTAALSGDLDVVADHGVYLDGTEYRVLSSNKVDGVFDSMNLPGSAILTFNPEQGTDKIDIEVDVASFKSVADNATEEAIGEYFDRLTPIASGELYDVIAKFQWLPESEFDQAFASVSPKQYGASSKEYIKTTRKSFHTIRDRLDGIRKSIAFAPVVNGMDATGNLEGFAGVSSKSIGIWYKNFVESFYEDDTGVTRLLLDSGNFNSCGYDTTFGKNLVAGFGRDYSEVTTPLDFTNGDGVVSGFKNFAYGSYMLDDVYMDLAFFYGNETYSHHRDLTIGDLKGSTVSEHDGESFSSYFETGKLLTSGSTIFQPFGSLEYMHFMEEGFTESGGGPLALKIEDMERDQLVLNLGIRAAKMWALDRWTIMPGISVGWRYNIEPGDYSTKASFVSAPGEYFVIDGEEDSTHALAVGASLDIANAGKFRSILDFSGELFNHENRYDVGWKLEYNF